MTSHVAPSCALCVRRTMKPTQDRASFQLHHDGSSWGTNDDLGRKPSVVSLTAKLLDLAAVSGEHFRISQQFRRARSRCNRGDLKGKPRCVGLLHSIARNGRPEFCNKNWITRKYLATRLYGRTLVGRREVFLPPHSHAEECQKSQTLNRRPLRPMGRRPNMG